MTGPVYPVKKFFRRGFSEIHWLPAVASPLTGPTRTEITGGINLSPAVNAVAGFGFTNSPIAAPDLSTTFNSQIPGSDAADNSSLTFNDDKVDETIRTALAKGTDGFVFLMPYGDDPTSRGEVWPATSTGYNDQWDMGDTVAMAMCAFAITSPPNQNATIPAAV